MAIDIPYQSHGLGSKLLEYADEILKKEKARNLWCNARQSAVKFYQKNRFKISSEVFQIEGIGPHYVMEKVIS